MTKRELSVETNIGNDPDDNNSDDNGHTSETIIDRTTYDEMLKRVMNSITNEGGDSPDDNGHTHAKSYEKMLKENGITQRRYAAEILNDEKELILIIIKHLTSDEQIEYVKGLNIKKLKAITAITPDKDEQCLLKEPELKSIRKAYLYNSRLIYC